MKDMADLDPAVKLLTILNVQSAHLGSKHYKQQNKQQNPLKRNGTTSPTEASISRDWYSIAKRAKVQDEKQPVPEKKKVQQPSPARAAAHDEDHDQDHDPEQEQEQLLDDPFELHWSTASEAIPTQLEWGPRQKRVVPQLATFHESSCATSTSTSALVPAETSARASQPSTSSASSAASSAATTSSSTATLVDPKRVDKLYNSKLLDKYRENIDSSASASLPPFDQGWLSLLSTYKDVLYPTLTPQRHDQLRAATRIKVLKNNEHLSKLAASTPAAPAKKGKPASAPAASSSSSVPPRNIQDQGFTRPKVLVLAPFRNSAHAWVDLLTRTSQAETIENRARFDTEYLLPAGASDKLAENPQDYPADHVETFRGNIDDSFRLGIKVTRKSLKLFSEFYSCDVIVASPLGLRTSIEKEKDDADFLSSIEILIVDQMDVMLMQNWDHVSFIMDRLNKLPEESHGCDFSRVKPWYLDGKASHLRQSILLSAYETPEIRSLYNRSLVNIEGKLKAEVKHDGLLTQVPKGVKQVFTRFECADVYKEDDMRFEHFTTKTLPMLRRSAVSSSQTIIFVPSYFDFVRLKKYLKKLDDFSFSSISEYTPTPDVSRARGAFFAGKTSFLLVTERFHFFRRYRLRGAKTFVFYAPPDHPQFYPEILSFPFTRPGQVTVASYDDPNRTTVEDIDASEITSQVIFSKFDLLRLERICGDADARRMTGAGADETKFAYLF
ncbi:BZ3500_MvSof-1268-A1-R1_Chr7-2g09515 [Microbotryum saponariae]|uniref:U3 small nucleolar RNA-associated protein 25 n=1 Tax=Microbotryum saponariae TaxID=289078 RepID=A0A2X0KYY1_9BASI|nr:BZ3501_MvSof-1269-A2-R1_Chr7-1g09215 [Microbotryum saponariae]SDA02607.1 BZ3500_MvSof-1268-A1-R1_Chr7-2g09515 [Microbotryum saponariae]